MHTYLNSLAYKLLAEELAESDQHPERKPERSKNLRRRLGGLLVTLGQKMQANGLEVQAAFEDRGYPPFDDEVRV